MSVTVRQVSSPKPKMMKQANHEDKEQLHLLARQQQKHPLSKGTIAAWPVLVEVLLWASSRRRYIPLCTVHTLAMSQPKHGAWLQCHDQTSPVDPWFVTPWRFNIQGTKRFNIEILERRSICSWYSQPAISRLNSPWEMGSVFFRRAKVSWNLKLSDIRLMNKTTWFVLNGF